jgi:hypothetical protein
MRENDCGLAEEIRRRTIEMIQESGRKNAEAILAQTQWADELARRSLEQSAELHRLLSLRRLGF